MDGSLDKPSTLGDIISVINVPNPVPGGDRMNFDEDVKFQYLPILACVRACMRACVCACVCACVRACVCTHVRAVIGQRPSIGIQSK